MGTIINTGELLKTYFDVKRIRRAALARVMGRPLKSILYYEKKSDIKTSVLWELCMALHYNFFMDIAIQLPTEFACGTDIFKEKNRQIASLENEVAQLKREKEILMELIKSNNK